MFRKFRFMLLTIATLLVAVGVQAQVTTSSMGGKVVDNTNEPVIGATVQAVHEPSGTLYGAITNIDGRYAIQGMRTGGPYTVTISYVGYQSRTYTDITLQLGEIFNLNAEISESSELLGEVVVIGTASKFAQEKTGATTNINNATIQNLPTVSRSITDIARLSPYANGMGFAGGDGRSTNFTVDGANFNNNFGLSSDLPGGGSPISVDAIEEMQVVVAPFDVRQSNFIGGGINAVTKSGTNTFKGTAYTYYANENLHGTRIGGVDIARTKDRKYTYGATLGGPIIKNKLFFFANVEYSKSPTVANRWMPSPNGVAIPDQYISRTSTADMQKVSDFVKQKYGYDTGSYTDFPADENNIKLLGRIDWNINQNHHLAVRYNYTKNTAWNPTNGNSGNTGYRLRGMDRLSKYSMAFANSMYSMNNKVNTVSVDLNSHFGSNYSNQLLLTYSDIQDVRGSNSAEFPFIDIMYDYEMGDFPVMKKDKEGVEYNAAYDFGGYNIQQTLEPYMSLGYELFTWNNKVQNKVTTITDNFTAYLGNHKLTAGINFEHQLANNSYMRNGTGYYRYRSLDDFLNERAPEAVALAYGYGGESNPTAQVTFNQVGLYVQDEWNVLDNLKLTAGIRFDNIHFDNDDIMRNNAIYELDYGGKHVDTGAWPKNNIQVSPRFGFNWDVFGNKSLTVRGGTGLFAGRLPLVFFTNMPTNSGMIQNLVTANTQYTNGVVTSVDSRLDKFAGQLVTDRSEFISRLGAPSTITPSEGTVPSDVNGVDHNFKMPQVWKTSIAVDYQVPVSFPLSLTGEFNYTKNINAVRLVDWNIMDDDSGWERFSGADNRLIYPASFTYQKNPAYVLTNTHKGYGWTANFTVNATPLENLNIMASYTHTVMKEVSGMPGSNAGSAWQGLYTIDGPNRATVQNSQYVVPDRVIASVNYTYHKDHFTLFYTGYSPSGYSYYYTGDMNNDGIAGDLMYIPKNDSEIVFVDKFDSDGNQTVSADKDREAFWKFVEQDSYLKNHKGEYAEAYSARSPWVHRFDFRWAHDFTLNVGNTKHLLQLSADIENIGNLIHSSWGVAKIMTPANNGAILKYEGKNDANQPTFSLYRDAYGEAPTKTWEYNRAWNQTWRIQLGVKYYFN
ncbi:MAG: carboxypeptidase regulatory-like domain-containing protein [Bacteroidaceae bacterium]|nr:carboxypeptidase regulatory-like domain-containing protein [Bacteroidaceae bacterium]